MRQSIPRQNKPTINGVEKKKKDEEDEEEESIV